LAAVLCIEFVFTRYFIVITDQCQYFMLSFSDPGNRLINYILLYFDEFASHLVYTEILLDMDNI